MKIDFLAPAALSQLDIVTRTIRIRSELPMSCFSTGPMLALIGGQILPLGTKGRDLKLKIFVGRKNLELYRATKIFQFETILK